MRLTTPEFLRAGRHSPLFLCPTVPNGSRPLAGARKRHAWTDARLLLDQFLFQVFLKRVQHERFAVFSSSGSSGDRRPAGD
jgi:hypothetical protein